MLQLPSITPETVSSVLVATIGAAIYAAAWYFRARSRDDEPFDPYKFGATLLVGAGIGLVVGLGGGEIARESIETQLAAFVGLISLVEAALKALIGDVDRDRVRKAGHRRSAGSSSGRK